MKSFRFLRRIAKAAIPYGFIVVRRRMRVEQQGLAAHQSRHQYHAERKSIINSLACQKRSSDVIDGSDYKAIMEYLIDRGIPENHLKEGSVPAASLRYIEENAINNINSKKPLLGLHVGNFVGVSLIYITKALTMHDPKSICISIDPNLTHRGVTNPQAHVLALLSKCDLQCNSIVISGYSGEKSVSNDATVFAGYDPKSQYQNETACERVIANLVQLLGKKVDLVFLDGNHDADYLKKEIKDILPLMQPGGYIVLDDVDDAWEEIRKVFRDLGEYGLNEIGEDGRVGIVQYRG